DEPTAGLDPIGAANFDNLTRDLADTLGLTVFLITHDLDTLYAICDRVAVLADKKVVAVGTIPELLELDHPWIQEYFGGPRSRAAQVTSTRAKAMDNAADGKAWGKPMDARADFVGVGAVSLLLLGLLALFSVWLAQLGNSNRKEYDIFFPQSVAGLANGSEVTFKGVPAGQVKTIELWTKDPEFVRVRVSLRDDIPILQGTTASISASFTGV